MGNNSYPCLEHLSDFFNLLYSLKNSERKSKPTDVAQNMQDSLETLFLKTVESLQRVCGASKELN